MRPAEFWDGGEPGYKQARMMPKPADRFALPALLTGAVCIAFSPIFVRWSEVGPTAAGVHRVGLAVPMLFAWLWFTKGTEKPWPEDAQSRRALILAGIFFAGDLFFWHWSILFTTVANATLLANFTPIMVTGFAWLAWGQRPTLGFLAGMALALGGAATLMGVSFGNGPRAMIGDGFGLMTALFYGSYLVVVARARAHLSTAAIMAWSSLITSIVLIPIAWASGETLVPTTLNGWLVGLGLALVVQCLGQGLIAYALAALPAQFSAVALLLQPATAAILAWVLFNEALGPWQALGAVLVLAGVAQARRATR